MKIGIDLDGVVYDTERAFRYYADYYSYFELGKDRLHPEFSNQEKAFEWTREQTDYFFKKYYDKVILAEEMLGVREILQRLQAEGHELYIITTRGIDGYQHEIDLTIPKLKEMDVEFAGMFFAQRDKFETCKKIGIDVMIDDRYENVSVFAGSDMVVLYFRETFGRHCDAKNIIEVDSWMKIYREIQKLSKIK